MKRSRTTRGALPIALAVGVAVVASACGAANEVPAAGAGAAATLNGAGASTQQAAFQAWRVGFVDTHPGVRVNYDPVGSGGGRKQFLTAGVSFAGSDAYLSDEELDRARERCDGGDAVDLPVYVSAIALAYNLPGVSDLTLSPATIAKIFDQQITDWSDPAITADHGSVVPAGTITVVNRSDDSGTTENFIDYLTANAPRDFPHEVTDTWPVPGGEAAKGTAGVISSITTGAGSIGYADESQVSASGLPSAKVVAAGEAVGPSAEAASRVVDVSSPVPGRPAGDLAIDVDRTPDVAGAYPIVLISYQIACTRYATQAEADLVKDFIGFAASQEGQARAAAVAGTAPLSAQRSEAIEASLQSITGVA